MQPTNLHAVDLNLLKVLDALLGERSISAAGRRIGLSQPATSHALRRLRELLGDPLLVRGAVGFDLTPHATALQQPVRQALAAAASALRRPERFDPLASRRTFRIAATDLTALAVLPGLLAALARDAPEAEIVCHSGEAGQVTAQLREGELDLALGVYSAPAPDLLREPIVSEDFVLLVRAGHPLLDGELTLERLAGFPAIVVSPGGSRRGFMDGVLERHGFSRRVAATVPHFLLAPYLIRGSDLTLVFPRSLATEVGPPLGLAVRPLPIGLEAFNVHMMWTRRGDSEPALAWLRELVRKVVGCAAAA